MIHKIVFEGETSFPVQAVEDHRQHGGLLEAGGDHRDIPHQGPPSSLVSPVTSPPWKLYYVLM